MNLNVLKAVWGSHNGFVFVPRKRKGVWDEGEAFSYPDSWDSIKNRVEKSVIDGWDTYWCPLLFDKPKRLKENVSPTCNILWADLDAVNPTKLGALKPTVAWASSDERYQALWALDARESTLTVEGVNKDLSYHIGADKGGWDITQVLRVPGTKNYKYSPPQDGKLLWAEKRLFNLEKVKTSVRPTTSEPLPEPTENLKTLLEGWALPERVSELLNTRKEDVIVGERSERLWEIETLLVEAGLPILEIVKIISVCEWNKFKGRKGEQEHIYREVLKAEQHVKSRSRSTISLTTDPTGEALKQQVWALPFKTFATKDMSPPMWLVDNIWQVGTYGMIAGEPKTYKSVQATDLALSVASGRPFLGSFNVNMRGAVLYIQEENNEQTVQDRLFKIAESKGLLSVSKDGFGLKEDLPIYFSNNYGVDLTDKSSRELIEKTIQEIEPVLVILDPLYMMLGRTDENSAKEVGEVLRWLTYLRNQYKCAILVCHHYNKGSVNARGGQRVRGSGAFHAWVESALYVSATAERGKVKIEREFRAASPLAEIEVQIEMGSPGELFYKAVVKGTEDDMTLDLKREEVCAVLSATPRTFTELTVLCKMSHADLKTCLTELMADGLVTLPDASVVGGRGKKALYTMTVRGEKGAKKGVSF